ncbi:MAG: hypothetical protein RL329_2265 [Bacteroidota bacterium]|jgi:uncharacterized protein YydD (DUF2326 family)
MFLKSLTISKADAMIREIHFRMGLNLVVDETPIVQDTSTGNDVGKTTVLKLIDFCLGAKAKGIYVDPESKKQEYALVKDFLIKQKVLIKLVLTNDLDAPDASEIVIERNFLARKELIRRINGQDLTEDEFEMKLKTTVFPAHEAAKPTFRQIISHNLRYEDESITNTLRTLNPYSTDAEYETLHLFLLGCDVMSGNLKQSLLNKISQEQTFKKRLEKQQTKTAYQTALALLEEDIKKINQTKALLNVNERFEQDLDELNGLKYQIHKVSQEISKLTIRIDMIREAKQELEASVSKMDVKQLKVIYQQATQQIANIQKTFEDLVDYHNLMIVEKVRFITQELPMLEKTLVSKKNYLQNRLIDEKKLSVKIVKTDSFEMLEQLVAELNEKFRKKGEYEKIIQQLEEIEKEIEQLNQQLEEIDNQLFSDDFEQLLKNKKDKFNKYFAAISRELYGEQQALNYDIVENKKGQKLYKFTTFNVDKPNLSSGKKQGEISCFDIAYILFADEANIPCLHFILNDKKELMHDNQLVKIAGLVQKNKIQFVASILKDKLPLEINDEQYFILKLSQSDKLFKIEAIEEAK